MTIATIRALIPDLAQYDQAQQVGDGGNALFSLPNRPAQASTVAVYVAGALKTLTTDYTVNAELGLVTFVVAPALAAAVVIAYQHTLLSDATLQVYLDLEEDDRLAAADALDAIASNVALVERVGRLGDLQYDGRATADALRKHATALREQAEAATGFEVATMITTDFSYREHLINQALRGY